MKKKVVMDEWLTDIENIIFSTNVYYHHRDCLLSSVI